MQKALSPWWAIVIGSGLALSPIHNQWLTDLTTNSKGEAVFFLPAFGHLLTILGSELFLLRNWKLVRQAGLGDKRIAIPLLIIVAAIGLSGIGMDGFGAKVAPLGMALALFSIYLAARIYGKGLFIPLTIGAVVASVGVLSYQALFHRGETGGFVFERNYDIAVGYILMGAALFVHKWRWLLASLALIAVLLTGAWEGLFAVGVLGVVLLLRRDWSRRIVVPVLALSVVAFALFVSGYAQTLYTRASEYSSQRPEWGDSAYVLGDRWTNLSRSMSNLKPLGEGYNITDFGVRYRTPDGPTEIVHNVPAVILQQLGWPGILAGIAWLWVSVRCLIKTRWKYAWALVLSLSVFDHFVWTQIGPVWWAVVGVSVSGDIGNDLVFRTVRE